MNPQRRQYVGMRIWIVSACVILLAANIGIHGWNCWGFRPGGSFSAVLYVIVLVLSLPSLPGMFTSSARISDPKLRCSLLYLSGLLALGHLLLNVIYGPSIFTSAHIGPTYRHAAFLSSAMVAVSPDLVRMSFSSRQRN